MLKKPTLFQAHLLHQQQSIHAFKKILQQYGNNVLSTKMLVEGQQAH